MTEPEQAVPFSSVLEALPDTVPFVAPEELERKRGYRFKARIGANESAFGISPKAEAALHQAIGVQGCSWYGDPSNHELRRLLSEKLHVSPDTICVDAGIDSLLGLTVRLFIEPGSVFITSKGAYPTVNYHVLNCGGIIKTVPYNDNHEDTEALARAAHKHGARLVYLANPDNPMGTCVSAEAIEQLIKQLPDSCVLLLDEAYHEFMTDVRSPPIDTERHNVVRFRTFSKAYGMAGMRIGYAISNTRLIRGYDKVRNHFGVNKLAQIAATASLADETFLRDVQTAVQQGRQRIYELTTQLNLPFLESYTNFVAVDLGSGERANTLLELLGEHGIFMRKPMQTPQDRFIRVGVGSLAEHRYLQEALLHLVKQI